MAPELYSLQDARDRYAALVAADKKCGAVLAAYDELPAVRAFKQGADGPEQEKIAWATRKCFAVRLALRKMREDVLGG